MLPYVSIALATYNVEEFVRDSLECIVNQTLKNIEIICNYLILLKLKLSFKYKV